MKILTEEIRRMEAIADAIAPWDRILVVCHKNPDGDAIGSAWGLAHALRGVGKKARAFCGDEIPPEYLFLTENETQDEFEPEHVVTVDVAAASLLPEGIDPEKIDLVIDHHPGNSLSAPLKLVDPEAAACGEILAELVDYLDGGRGEIDGYAAEAFYTALATDTGCFKYSNVTENTFLTAAMLLGCAEKGAFYRINKRVFDTKSQKRLALEAWAIGNVSLSAGGRIAFLNADFAMQKQFETAAGDLDGLINVIRQIEGVAVSIVLKQKEENLFKASVRAETGFDASAFCAVFGGGGHRAAAGCSFTSSAEEAREKLLAEAERRLP